MIEDSQVGTFFFEPVAKFRVLNLVIQYILVQGTKIVISGLKRKKEPSLVPESINAYFKGFSQSTFLNFLKNTSS